MKCLEIAIFGITCFHPLVSADSARRRKGRDAQVVDASLVDEGINHRYRGRISDGVDHHGFFSRHPIHRHV